MKISGLYEVFFSPTGHTKKVVEVFSKAWNTPKTRIDLTNMNNEFDKYDIYSDDLCVFAVPSYCGRVPITATQRINQIKGNNTPAIIISTYGNRDYEDTLCELQDIVQERGFYVVAALAVPTEHSIVPEVAKGRIDDADIEKLTAMAIAIREYVAQKDGFNCAKLKGNEEYKELKNLELIPILQGKCLDCGICAKNCPVGAIPLDNVKESDEAKCISCMRCVTYCPSKSRIVPKIKLSPIVNKLKKECEERKEIEIFINNNTGNTIAAMDAYQANKLQKVEKVEKVVLPSLDDMSDLEPVVEESVLPPLDDMSDLEPVVEESVLPPLDDMSDLEPVVEESVLPPLDDMSDLEPVVEESVLPKIEHIPSLEPVVEETILPSLDDMPDLGPVIEEIKKTEEIKKNSDFGVFDDLVLEPLPELDKTSIVVEEDGSEQDNNIIGEDIINQDSTIEEPEFEINGAPVDEGPVKIEIPQDKILPPPPVIEDELLQELEPVEELESLQDLEPIPDIEPVEDLESLQDLEPIPDIESVQEIESIQNQEPVFEKDESQNVEEENTTFEFKMGDLVDLVNEIEKNENTDKIDSTEIKENISEVNNIQENVQKEEAISITQLNLEEMMQIQEIEPPKAKEEKKVEVENLESVADSLFDF